MGYVYIALTVILTVYGQLVLKWQVGRIAVPAEGLQAKFWFFAQALTNPWVLSGLAAAFAASLCWMLALTRLPLSTAYPFTASSFLLVLVVGVMFLGESLTVMKTVGTLLVVIGLATLAAHSN